VSPRIGGGPTPIRLTRPDGTTQDFPSISRACRLAPDGCDVPYTVIRRALHTGEQTPAGTFTRLPKEK
jgi:hypothetical protein